MEKRKNVPVWQTALSASCGGILEGLCLFPLDFVKSRLQLDKTRVLYGGSAKRACSVVLRNEGFFAFYQGLSPALLNLVLKYSMRFGIFGAVTKQARFSNDPVRQAFAAGAVAGAVEGGLCVTPFEVIKVRLQAQNKASQKSFYRGTIPCAIGICRSEGVQGMFKGFTATALRQSSNQAFNFATVAILKPRLTSTTDSVPPLWKTALVGLVAGAIGPVFNNPIDVAKSTLQANPGKNKTTWQTMQNLYTDGGIRSLYAGLGTRLVRVAPGQAIVWATVLNIESFLSNKTTH